MTGVEGKVLSKDPGQLKQESRAPKKEWRKMSREERLAAQGLLADADVNADVNMDGDGDEEEEEENAKKSDPVKKVKEKRKQRGRDKSLKRYLRKKKGIIDESSVSILICSSSYIAHLVHRLLFVKSLS